MDGEPGEPRWEAAHVRLEGPLNLGNGGHAADGGHVAFVEVAESRARLSGEVGGDHFGDVIAHLHSGLGDAGDLMAILLEVSQVAENEDLRQARRIELVVDDDAAAAVEFDLEVTLGGAASILPRGEARTPAAQSVTAAPMCMPCASTHPGPTAVTCVLVCTSMPRRLSVASALADRSSG